MTVSVTIKDIAEKFGVAPSTVSNVLNGRNKGSYAKTAKRAEQIRRYAESRGYRPSAAARAVRSNRTYQVGILLPNRADHPHTHPNAFEGVLGLNSGMQECGYVVSIIRFDDLTTNIRSHTRLFSEQSLDGLVVFGQFPDWALQELRALVPAVVWMDTGIWEPTNCIRRDEAAAARQAVEQAAALGYRRLIWLGYPDRADHGHYSQVARRGAALAAAQAAGMEVEEAPVEPWAGLDHWQGLETRLRPDTVVLAQTTYHAQLLSHRVAAMGMTPPRDFGLVCCESSQEIDRLWPGLSRVSFDRFDMGRQAGDMLRALLDEAGDAIASRRVSGQWVAGDSARSQQPT